MSFWRGVVWFSRWIFRCANYKKMFGPNFTNGEVQAICLGLLLLSGSFSASLNSLYFLVNMTLPTMVPGFLCSRMSYCILRQFNKNSTKPSLPAVKIIIKHSVVNFFFMFIFLLNSAWALLPSEVVFTCDILLNLQGRFRKHSINMRKNLYLVADLWANASRTDLSHCALSAAMVKCTYLNFLALGWVVEASVLFSSAPL